MSDDAIDVNFFDKLRRAVSHVETSVRELKTQADNEFNKYVPMSAIDYDKVKKFESQIRSTYSETAIALGSMKSEQVDFDKIEKGLIGLELEIENFVDKIGWKKYNYKPWVNPCPIIMPVDTDEEEDIVDSLKPKEVVGVEERMRPPSPAPTVTIRTSPLKSSMSKASNEKKRKTEKPNRTPQPSDFGITANRRFTMLPKSMLRPKEPEVDIVQPGPGDDDQYSTASNHSISYMQPPPQKQAASNPFAGDATTMFNLPTVAMARYDLPSTPNRSEMYSQDQITVEFTPGLTTRRPAGIRRIKSKPTIGMELPPPPPPMVERTRSLREINMDFDKHLPATPKQPIVSKSVADSAKMIKSMKKLQSDTPQMPSLSIDQGLHMRLRSNRYNN